MPLSASTLIHFTDSKDALKGILRDDFRIHYCREEVTLGRTKGGYAAPMVSFCDIPLSEIKNHISKYGQYGIGLTKAWGKKAKLNPVLYVAQGSNLGASYLKAFLHFGEGNSDEWTNEQRSLIDVLRYVKNYEADLKRNGKTIKKYRFSDEREWRYVPPYSSKCNMILPLQALSDSTQKAAANAAIADLSLSFTPNDIKYIIIKSDHEIGEFIDHLRRTKGSRYTLDDVERLTTRILTAEQILEDI